MLLDEKQIEMYAKRHEMYESYLRVARYMKKTPLSFAEWMVKRGFGYSTVDKRWARC